LIPDNPEWQGVRNALIQRGLDPSNPLHVMGLLKIAFPASGRPPRWTDAERARLAIEFCNAKVEVDGKLATDADPGTRDKKICDRLATSGRFGGINGLTLKRQLDHFRNPGTNQFLRLSVEAYCANNPSVAPKEARQHILAGWDAWEDAEGNFYLLPGGVNPKLVPQLAISRQEIEAFEKREKTRSVARKRRGAFRASRGK